MMTVTKQLLLIIVVLGFCLRIVNVGGLPAILNRDEAALAYNALLLKTTGQDEWSKHWPLALESFGDFKLIGYPAMLTVFFGAFGTSDMVVRLPSVIAGTALIAIAFWWGRKLNLSQPMSLLLSLLVAVTPVFWFYSRIAFEANVALALFVSAIGLVWWPNKKMPVLTDLMAIGLTLVSVYTYNTPLLLLPFIIVTIPMMRGIRQWRQWGVPVVGMVLLGLSAASVLLPLSSRKSGITIFSDETVWQQASEYRQHFSGITQKVLGQKYVYFAQIIAKNYMASISPNFLVLHGGTHPWHQLPDWGHLYWTTYILAIWGLVGSVVIVLKAKGSLMTRVSAAKNRLLVMYLAVVGLLPAVVTVDAPHATRSLLFLFSLLILAVFGLDLLQQCCGTSRWLHKIVLPVVVFLILIESFHYGYLYFGQFPQQQAVFQAGYDVLIQQVERDHANAQIAVVDGGGYQYILTAWYLKTDPSTFFSTIVKQLPDRIGFRYGERLQNIHFIAQAADRSTQETVLIEWDNEALQWKAQYF